MFFQWRPYVSVAERRRKAAAAMARRAKQGLAVSPVVLEDRTIARTFWGKAWCENLESYSDYANRLPRGRTYVRNGSVVDLQIGPGEVKATVAGSELYEVRVTVAALPKPRWRAICADCAGAISSLLELLQGRLSAGVMERLCQQKTGLFPSPNEIGLSCSCPDWASMCKHVAAVLYGVGARLDDSPELLFKLRQVDEKALIAKASRRLPLAQRRPAADKVVRDEDLSALFGLELATDTCPKVARARHGGTRPARKKPAKAPPRKKAAPAASRATSARRSARKATRTRR